jgi:soluble epoxide hydrolase/lipid-phosphate phosphatase
MYLHPSLTNPVIEIPTLFIAAKKDPTIPEMMYAHVGKFIPDLTLRVVNTHHWAMIEDPNGVNKIITEWIKEVVFAGKAKF